MKTRERYYVQVRTVDEPDLPPVVECWTKGYNLAEQKAQMVAARLGHGYYVDVVRRSIPEFDNDWRLCNCRVSTQLLTTLRNLGD